MSYASFYCFRQAAKRCRWLAYSLLLLIVLHLIVLHVADFGMARPQQPEDPKVDASQSLLEVDFNREIQPILAAKCFACHGPDEEERQADLRLDNFAGATLSAVVPGEAAASDLLARIATDDEQLLMPPSDSGKQRLTPGEVELIRRWIDQGAGYDQHWSLQPLRRPTIPEISDFPDLKSGHPVDLFVARVLAERGLEFSSQEEKSRLARRVALDLTGLPPDPTLLHRYLRDSDPSAYDHFVRALLADSAYGEHWASYWLDLARYADTDGYADDLPRTIWPYRDWVIDAYNRDLPFDQFSIEQLAGDLLPNATLDQKIATGFHRNTLTNSEGGTIDEEFRTEAVTDRVDTTMQVWMGLTFGCAKCHSHKYDPISHDDYYQLYAIFNQTADEDRGGNPPFLKAYSRAFQEQALRLEQEIADLEQSRGSSNPQFRKRLLQWLAGYHHDSQAWQPFAIAEAASSGGASLQTGGDELHRVFASGSAPERDTYRLHGIYHSVPQQSMTALRLSVEPISVADQPAQELVGRSPNNGNFVISEVILRAKPIGQSLPEGKFVRLELPGSQRMIHIAELEVHALVSGQAQLVSRTGKAKQSSTAFNGPPHLAIDGNTSGVHVEGSVTHTAVESDPWFELELAEAVEIQSITIHNRTDGDLHRRLNGVVVQVLNEQRQVVWQHEIAEASAQPMVLPTDEWRQVPFAFATADYWQSNDSETWHAGRTIDGDLGSKGWAVGGQQERPHQLVLQLAQPLPAEHDWELAIEILQNYGQQHTLSNVAMDTTTRSTPQIAMPESLSNLAKELADGVSPADLFGTLNDGQRSTLETQFATTNPLGSEIQMQLTQLREQLNGLPWVNTPVMEELPEDRRRPSRLLIKGSWLNPSHEVQPGLPEALTEGQSLERFIQHRGQRWDRLALAQWLFDPSNPLVARVAVNRVWARIFGRGLVETEEDFGTMGTIPTHPELLDWLARYYMEDVKWSQKELLYLLVTSHAYRQSSGSTADSFTVDPENRWLSRGPRNRLSAEQIRDQALAISELLNREMYGPGIVPRLPVKELGSAFSGQTLTESSGPALYRRGVYIYVRRTGPYPTVLTFDGTNRQVCTVRRIHTNTPLQALVTLNDPVYFEAAQGLARLILRQEETELSKFSHADEPSTNVDGLDNAKKQKSRLLWGFQQTTGRLPNDQEVRILMELLAAEWDVLQADSDAARRLATEPLGTLPDGLSPVEAAAWTVVANVLLNLDELMTK